MCIEASSTCNYASLLLLLLLLLAPFILLLLLAKPCRRRVSLPGLSLAWLLLWLLLLLLLRPMMGCNLR